MMTRKQVTIKYNLSKEDIFSMVEAKYKIKIPKDARGFGGSRFVGLGLLEEPTGEYIIMWEETYDE